MPEPIRIGTAGWALHHAIAAGFPGDGPHLQRYARRFAAVEIDSSFYRPHRTATYARWAASTPDGFRFAVKLPRRITHALRLAGAEADLDRFIAETAGLGPKLGVILVQLPPSLAFADAAADAFFAALRRRHAGGVAVEPRHPSWFIGEADALLAAHRAARVGADPALVPAAGDPGGWDGLVYLRWHGSPEMYRTPYGAARLDELAGRHRLDAAPAVPTWCIFDNTASGAAVPDALLLRRRLGIAG